MKIFASNINLRRARGSILVIVLWIAFGLCAVTLYFAHSMSLEYQAADNEVAGMEAEQAIEGGALYVSNMLEALQVSNSIPSAANYRADAVKVGNGQFWLIGRDTNDLTSSGQADHPFWGLVDEASKVNLNHATAAMLINLPQMTSDLSAAMFDWQSATNAQPSPGGAKSETYSGLNPPYVCKSAPYETVEELNLVYGMNLDYLFGEDANYNGMLDPNENDGLTTPPNDNQNGILDPGVLEYCTVWTKGESLTASNGIARIAINNTTALTQFITSNYPSLLPYVQTAGGGRANSAGSSGGGRTSGMGSSLSGFPSGRGGNGTTVPTAPTGGGPTTGGGGAAAAAGTYTSVFQFYVQASARGMSDSDFQQIEPYLMNPSTAGLINVNTATATALACIPGIGLTLAPQVLAYRQSNPQLFPSITWLKTALSADPTVAAQVGPYITPYSYVYTADIAAVGHYGRGYRRVRFVFDCSSGTPLIVYRQDLTHLGWALGGKLHDQLLAQNSK